MSERKELVLEIKAYTPDTIPMARLAEYMNNLARLLGEPANVHFVRLDPGSTGLVHAVEFEAIPKVRERVTSVRGGTGPSDAMAAYQAIDRMLRDDNADGALRESDGAQIIQFPGARAEKKPDFGIISQQTTLDGRIIRMGGKGKLVPIMLETHGGFETHCEATRETARELRNLYDGPIIRFSGNGKWSRADDVWTLEKFQISAFEALDERGLLETVADLRDLPDADWKVGDDVWRRLEEIRGTSEDD